MTTVVVGDLLPWPEDKSTTHADGPFDVAAIYQAGIRQDCVIRKISALGATIGSDLAPALGERVSIEIATGQRPVGKIAWTGRSELGVRFEDCIDIIALLNRKLVSQAPDRRTMPRLELRFPVHIKCGGNFWPATLRNISTRGLQIEGDQLPEVGTYAAAIVDGLNVPAGEVVWKRQNICGIELFEELSWTSIIPWVRKLVRNN